MKTNKLKLTPEEEAALARLEEKYQDVRLFTDLVATGHSTGFYCYGWGGIGKSFNIINTLEGNHRPFILLNTRLSAPGLAQELHKNKSGLFVIEDVEDAFSGKDALDLLRSAFWGQRDKNGKMVRPITYVTGSDKWNFDFKFDGAIIATGNRALGDIPQLQALKTRIDVLKLEAERDEILAVSKKIALGGYKCDKGALSPEKCVEIFEYYKAHLPDSRPPDLRILDRAYVRHLGLDKLGKSDRWQRLLLSTMLESSPVKVETPSRRTANVDAIAAELRTKYGANLKRILPEWESQTGQGKTAYYDALGRLDKRNVWTGDSGLSGSSAQLL